MRTAASVMSEARCALRPPPRLTLSQWADEKFYLSPDAGAADPGRWHTLPYQRDWMDALTDPRIDQVTIMKSARVGYTEVLKALVGYHVDHDACPILVVQPTQDDAKGFSKESIEPLLRDCPTVGEKFAPFARRNSMLLKRFRGGILQLAGARSPGNFRRVSRRIVITDEVDGYIASAGKEGDPLTLAEKRAESFWNRKRVRGSTPTDAGTSRIERLFLEGDQRRRYWPCPHCDTMQVLQLKHFWWPAGQPTAAVLICISCGKPIEEKHKREMDAAGEWRPGPHPQFPDVDPPALSTGHASFHIWSAYSYLPNATWGHVASEFVKANEAGAEKLKTYVNTWLGETWKERGEAPEWRRLYDRRETYAVGTCPMGVLFLTAGADVQHDRIVWEVVGWGRGMESWSIDAGVIDGDTSNLTPKGPWPELVAVLNRVFRHASGCDLRIRRLAVDSGDQTQTVYNWVRKQERGRVFAVKGVDSADVLIDTGSKVDVSFGGRRVGTLRLYHVGKTIAVREFYGWLRLELPTDDERADGAETPPGYCHFPAYAEQYFKELTALQLVTHRNVRGFPVQSWELLPGRTDDFLAARRYARAIASLDGMDRADEGTWARLEGQLGLPPAAHHEARDATRDVHDRPPSPSTTPAPAAAPPPPPKRSWLGPRRDTWVRRRR